VASNVFETTTIEQNKILYTYFPSTENYMSLSSTEDSNSQKDSGKAKALTEALAKDIKLIYPIGEPLSQSFKEAEWILTSDGILAVQLDLSKTNLLGKIILVGTLGTQNDTIQAHMAGTVSHGIKITIDGLLQPSNTGFRIDGIFTATVRDAQHVEQITLHLREKLGSSAPEWGKSVIDKASETLALKQSTHEEDHLLSEPTEWIGGVPVTTIFEVTLIVKLDDVKLKSMKGQLILSKVEGLAESTIGVLLTTEGSVVPGWSVWKTSQSTLESSKTEDPSIKVTTNDGHMRVVITSPLTFGEIIWYARNPEHPDENVLVLVEEGVIDIQLKDEGKNISGTINAQGKVLAGYRPASTFSAELSGRQQGKDLFESVEGYVGARPFDGRWCDPKIGELSLHQQSNKVSGKFFGDDVEEGIVTDSVLNLRWKTPMGESRQGFLSPASDGLLVGMTWSENKTLHFESVVAVQVPITGRLNSKTSGVTVIKNDEQARHLKLLAYDLSSAGKHRESAKILLQVVEYYHAREAYSKNDPTAYQDLKSNLLNQVLPLNSLISSAFEAGEYPTLVRALSMSLHVQNELQRDKDEPRSFHEQREKYIAVLKGWAENMNNLEAAFDRALVCLSASGIGVGFEEEANACGLIVSKVLSDTPASQAGVTVGDLILAIDGISIAGMNPEQVIISLQGNVGSSVSIRLLKDGQNCELTLVRAPLFSMSSEQHKDLSKYISAIREFISDTCNYYRTEVNKLAQLSKETEDIPVKEMSERVSNAFKKMLVSIEEHEKSIGNQRSTIITLAKRCLSKLPVALNLFERFVLLESMKGNEKLGKFNTEYMLKLDIEEEEFQQNPDVAEMDKSLLRLLIHIVTQVDVMQVDIMRDNPSSRFNRIKYVVKSSSQSSDAVETTNDLARLANWLDNWRSRMVTDAAKIQSLDVGQDFYEKYVKILIEMQLPEQALQASESARARAFADSLASSHATLTPSISSTSTNQENKNSLANLSSTQTITLEQILQLIHNADITVVEYFILESSLLIWVITPPKSNLEEDATIYFHQVQISRQILQDKVENLIATLKPLPRLATPAERDANEKEMLHDLKGLYDILIAPIENLLPKDPDRVVTIVPHACLFEIPFSALVCSNKSNPSYLLQDHTLTYIPSLAILDLSRQLKRKCAVSPSLLAVVQPTLDKALYNKEFSIPLPFIAEDFNSAITNFYNPELTSVLSDLEATQVKVLAAAQSRDVILFYTHAKAIPEDPLRSYIALSGSSLTAETISDQHLSSRLVILAACQTGLGKVTGDGVQGLARMFMVAGAETVMVSLWEVPQDTTLQLMYDFHQAWRNEGYSIAASLRRAQIQLLEIYPNVPMWAGFIIIGDER